MRLTNRDLDVIEAVHYYRVLKQSQLEALFFGLASDRTVSAGKTL